ncbi:probable vacuolar amino acid transporter YPQ3 [Andrographis paniculata]|uniref:probable vacuolar amino acid transporter YPQ3 n=1 Tax=Andrographis paniculata TaxID=175694 RepID=UPI0021E7CFC9|nr:probable vacuolar amino acid transporter YPQ3 [Andrographis paniculata]
MEILRSESVACPVDKQCWQWTLNYMGYCVCSQREKLSLVFGMIGVVSWGLAELPQIITSYKKKSSEGLSIFFLVAWIVGDIFNVLGCMLEPETLPTQYYTAVLYLLTALLLFIQSLYYRYIYPKLKFNRRLQESVEHYMDLNAEEVRIKGLQPDSSSLPSSEESYYLSVPMPAKSFPEIQKPTVECFPALRSSDLDNSLETPLLSNVRSTKSVFLQKIKTTLCVVLFVSFILLTCNNGLAASGEGHVRGKVFQAGRKLLESTTSTAPEAPGSESRVIGTLLGWGMAAIYLGGRPPQIYLNIKRGNAEGVNPLMFVLAIIGNGSYVASILLRSLDWSKIKPNLPWLVESSGCMFLDCFIVLQFLYFRYTSLQAAGKYVF